MSKATVCGLCLLGASAVVSYGQAASTASRTFDLQAGVAFVLDKSDYYPQDFRGYGIYADLDFKPHFGAEVDFRQANQPNAQGDASYERTYEIGGRYHRNYGRFTPYIKAMYGRGVFNFICTVTDSTGAVVSNAECANLAYNEIGLGGGVDFSVLRYLNVRADYEHQQWFGFPPHGLTPQVLTFGVAYHFPGDLKRGQHFK